MAEDPFSTFFLFVEPLGRPTGRLAGMLSASLASVLGAVLDRFLEPLGRPPGRLMGTLLALAVLAGFIAGLRCARAQLVLPQGKVTVRQGPPYLDGTSACQLTVTSRWLCGAVRSHQGDCEVAGVFPSFSPSTTAIELSTLHARAFPFNQLYISSSRQTPYNPDSTLIDISKLFEPIHQVYQQSEPNPLFLVISSISRLR